MTHKNILIQVISNESSVLMEFLSIGGVGYYTLVLLGWDKHGSPLQLARTILFNEGLVVWFNLLNIRQSISF